MQFTINCGKIFSEDFMCFTIGICRNISGRINGWCPFTTFHSADGFCCPLKLDHIEFGDYSYKEITSKEKLLEVLSYLLRIGDFKQYAGKTILEGMQRS